MYPGLEFHIDNMRILTEGVPRLGAVRLDSTLFISSSSHLSLLRWKKRCNQFFALCFLTAWDKKRSDRSAAGSWIRPDRIQTGEYAGSILKRVLTDIPRKRCNQFFVLLFQTGQNKKRANRSWSTRVIRAGVSYKVNFFKRRGARLRKKLEIPLLTFFRDMYSGPD
jgi:hypothetical protein